MAFLNIPNVKVVGISAGVPKRVIKNLEVSYRISDSYDNNDFVMTTGVEEFRFTEKLTTSDLCYEAAENLITQLQWEKSDIDAIIVVSQTLDYILPSTACILQDRLGLSKECFAEDIQLGCSGWVYGIGTLASMMQTGSIRKALLLVGDARQQIHISEKKWNHLFGMAGTVTALEYNKLSGGCFATMAPTVQAMMQ